MAKVGIIQYDTTPANNSDINSIAINENCPAANMNNAARQQMADIVSRFGTMATLASSGSPALGDQTSAYVQITGTTGITNFAAPTVANKFLYFLEFAGALTLTNGANNILPGGANITTAAGDTAIYQYEGTNVWRCLAYHPATGVGATGGTTATLGKALVANGSGVAPTWQSISALAFSYRALAIAGTAVAADNFGTINFTTAGVTLSLTAAATLGAGYTVTVTNTAATGVVTIDPNGAETLDGQATRKLSPGDRVTLVCDGSNFFTKSGEYSFTSADQTITLSSALTIAHGLGVLPKYTNMWLKCTNAAGANGYAQNDLIAISGTTVNIAAGDIFTATDSTSLSVIFGGTALAISPKTGGAQVGITTTNYAVVVRAVAN